jgi:hypothetical protein
MRPLLWFIALSIAIVTAVSALGVWLLIAPAQAGRALNEWYAIIPLADTATKRTVFRIFGLALLVVGTCYGMTGVWSAIRAIFS